MLSRFNRAELRLHYAFYAAMPTRLIALQRKLQVAYVGRTPAVESYSVMLKCWAWHSQYCAGRNLKFPGTVCGRQGTGFLWIIPHAESIWSSNILLIEYTVAYRIDSG